MLITMDVDVVFRVAWSPRSESIISDAHAGPVQPFCGADRIQSTPVSFMSTQTVPEAMQSSTNKPPCACIAAATFLM